MAARPTPLKKCKEGSKLFYCTDLLGKLHRRIVRLLKSFLNFQNSWFLLIIGIRSYGRQLFLIVFECLFITLIITIAKHTIYIILPLFGGERAGIFHFFWFVWTILDRLFQTLPYPQNLN